MKCDGRISVTTDCTLRVSGSDAAVGADVDLRVAGVLARLHLLGRRRVVVALEVPGDVEVAIEIDAGAPRARVARGGRAAILAPHVVQLVGAREREVAPVRVDQRHEHQRDALHDPLDVGGRHAPRAVGDRWTRRLIDPRRVLHRSALGVRADQALGQREQRIGRRPLARVHAADDDDRGRRIGAADAQHRHLASLVRAVREHLERAHVRMLARQPLQPLGQRTGVEIPDRRGRRPRRLGRRPARRPRAAARPARARAAGRSLPRPERRPRPATIRRPDRSPRRRPLAPRGTHAAPAGRLAIPRCVGVPCRPPAG